MTGFLRNACVCIALVALATVTVFADENPYMKKDKEDFKKVADHLDRYGNLFLYMNVAELTKSVDDFMVTLEKTVMPMVRENAEASQSQAATAAFKGMMELYRSSGIPGIGGLGISSLQTGKDAYRFKSFVYMDPAKPAGIIRNVMGGQAHPLTCIDFIPKEAAVATFCDFDLDVLWKWQYSLVNATGHPQLKQMHQMGLERLKGMVDLDTLLASTDKMMGLVITLDESNPVSIPVKGGQSTLKIPDPGIAIFLKTKDDTLKNYLFGKLVTKNEGKEQPFPFQTKTVMGVSYRQYPFPLPIPIQVTPCVATIDNYLVIASNGKVMDLVIAAKKSGNGLKSLPKYAELMKEMPTTGNTFGYVSPIFQKEMENVQRKLLFDENAPNAKMVQALTAMFSVDAGYSIGVGGFQKDGYYSVSKSNVNQGKMLMLQLTLVPVATTSIMAGMLLPVLSKAREKARRANCSGNLKQIGLASIGYSFDNNNNFPKDLATLVESGDLPASKVYVCPSAKDQDAPRNAADIRAGKCHYLYFGNGLRNDVPNAMRTIVACDKPTNHPGKEWINVLFADGHVGGCKAASIQEAARDRNWILPGADKKAR